MEQSVSRPAVTTIEEPLSWTEKISPIPNVVLGEVRIYSQSKKVQPPPPEKEKRLVCGEFRKEKLIPGWVKECHWEDVE